MEGESEAPSRKARVLDNLKNYSYKETQLKIREYKSTGVNIEAMRLKIQNEAR